MGPMPLPDGPRSRAARERIGSAESRADAAAELCEEDRETLCVVAHASIAHGPPRYHGELDGSA